MEHEVETTDTVKKTSFKMKFSGVLDAKMLESIEKIKNKLYQVEEDNSSAKDNLNNNKVNLPKEETSLFCDQTLLIDNGKRIHPSAESVDSTSNWNISENLVTINTQTSVERKK
ncbi:hypothetical protein TKK_0013114 [Trichogramma kaykai]|uniref:Uncharacterized protein n=1 Tax=Trichogramma kaykai TaxID=54128 RepID=A0ABD2WKV4_9HYME